MPQDQIDWNDPASVTRAQDYLRQKLRGRYSHIDEHFREASIEDALMHYEYHPESFDESRSVPLYYYLELRARSYLDMRLRKVRRRRKHEKAIGVSDGFFEKILSEMRGRRCINIGKESTEEEAEQQREEAERRKEALDAIMALLNPHDRASVELLRTGASREDWVRHLGIERLPENEQRRKVYAEKDRLMKKLKRRVKKM